MRAAFLLLAILSGTPLECTAAIDAQLLADNLPPLVGIENAHDHTNRLFLVNQNGKILIFNGNQVLTTPFLDISSLVSCCGEQGLLGLAFHPSYEVNGLFFVHYTDVNGNTTVARYQVSGSPNVADPASAMIILTENQPFSNHNGGQLTFGPDGFLYLALGDGGSAGDPGNRAQDLGTLLGKILRIDIDSASPYAIPPSNPFVASAGARGEIWVYGLRNPWRFSFDRSTGDMFIADVGQNAWEEVDFQVAGSNGQNYGWRRMEGFHCFNPPAGCDTGSLTAPVLEYSHSLGCSITGGFRYRGAAMPQYIGTYFFADYCTGRIWASTVSNNVWTTTQLLDTPHNITSFGQDESGELYYVNQDPGKLFKIVSSSESRNILTMTMSGAGSGRVSSSPAALDCGNICRVEAATGTPIALTATPGAGSTFVSWMGDADCTDGAISLSVDRACSAKFGLAFTDDMLSAGTVVKAVHITELRSRIDSLRTAANLQPFSWTNPLAAGQTQIRAAHITEMRTALDEVYTVRHLPLPSYTDSPLAAGDIIKGVDVAELRAAVLALE